MITERGLHTMVAACLLLAALLACKGETEQQTTEPTAPEAAESLAPAAESEPAPTAAKPKSPSEPKVVKTFEGKGAHTTRPFTVRDGWEIRWNATGMIFQVFLHTKAGDLTGVPANQQGAGKGSAFQPKGGSYYLTMNAVGKWKVEVVQL